MDIIWKLLFTVVAVYMIIYGGLNLYFKYKK